MLQRLTSNPPATMLLADNKNCFYVIHQLAMESQDILTSLPNEVLEKILQYLTIEDLCQAALCNRSWREAANQDVLWRPLCREKGWERHGTVHDLCKEPPFEFTQSNQEVAVERNEHVTFPFDAVVTSSVWPGLVDTCKWKEVCMKAWHLHANWLNCRYHTVSFEFGWDHSYDPGVDYNGPEPFVKSLAGDGEYLAGSISDDKNHLQIWNMSSGERLHHIEVDVSEEGDALQIKNGVIAAGCRNGEIRTFSVQTGEQLQVMSGHRLAVSHLFFDGGTIVSFARSRWTRDEVYSDSDIRVWNVADGACHILKSGCTGTRLIHFDYRDKIVAGAYDDGTIRVWNAENGSCIHQLVSETGKLISCHLGEGVTLGTYNNSIAKTWNLKSGECIKSIMLQFQTKPDSKYMDVSYRLIDERFLLEIYGISMSAIMDMEGNHIEDKDEFCEDCHSLVYYHTNKLFTELHVLYLVDQDGVKFNEFFTIDWKAHTYYTVAWMDDTKVAHVQYGQEPQMPKVFVHRYW